MTKLVLNPTELSQWHALVSDAKNYRDSELAHDLEAYLVLMLDRFTDMPDIIDTVFAIELMQGWQENGRKAHTQLRDLGDKCLLFSGLFSQQAQRRQVNVSYFVSIGQNAYHTLSFVEQNESDQLFAQLRDSFVEIVDVLQAVREMAANDDSYQRLHLADAWTIWQELADEYALKMCQRGGMT